MQVVLVLGVLVEKMTLDCKLQADCKNKDY